MTCPPYPGEALRTLLEREKITQDQLAHAMNVTRYSVNELVNQRRAMTIPMALRLGIALNTTAEFWLTLQQNVDLFHARARLGDQLEKIKAIR